MITNHAKYTVVLCELLKDQRTKTAIDNALSTYPLYEGKKNYDLIPTRAELNDKILKHYKYREIGFESVGRFVDELEITMCEIMPYYNELFKSVEIMADLENPFDNVDIVEKFEEIRTEKTEREGTSIGSQSATTDANNISKVEATGTTNSEATTEGSAEAERQKRFSNTPQNHVDNIDEYLTEYTRENDTSSNTSTETAEGSNASTTEGTDTAHSKTTNENTDTTTGSSEGTGTTEHTFTKKGNQGVNTYAHDMNEFRTSIIDVVDRILHDNRLAELFMLVW